jgi:DNA-binding CsgD family transcriptional regulator
MGSPRTSPPSAPRSGPSDRWAGMAIVATLLRVLDLGIVISARPRSAVDSLAKLELEVAREFAGGKSHKEVAAAFGTSPATVRSQVRSIYAKLGVATRVEQVRQIEAAG